MSTAGGDIDSAIAVYDRQARQLGEQWSAYANEFEEFVEDHRDYLPAPGGSALDIGAGYGSHASGLEALGLDVVAAEPSEGMRAEGARRHPESKVLWIDDRLPWLDKVCALGRRFDFMLMNSVWMHLPPEFREDGMAVLAGLLAPGGHFSVLLRHGPAPEDRPMHESEAEPFLALAQRHGFACLARFARPDEMNRPGVSFTRLILSNNG
ncbi:class I SAM-dependent methyltransferase [Nisaea acidiphila]|uniref:Class I SAM-dependent methyltransferase n=1 Tax=Nisaea acidiphila TaxID=1862145 RepID=A0A9J7AQV4_9PROT|nr:class I SAM-dependent methyltransferase [Nisaea acidiphila]UUX49987.1 class I SAM-dependent methyltransferase [Nisaea acidiphila]